MANTRRARAGWCRTRRAIAASAALLLLAGCGSTVQSRFPTAGGDSGADVGLGRQSPPAGTFATTGGPTGTASGTSGGTGPDGTGAVVGGGGSTSSTGGSATGTGGGNSTTGAARRGPIQVGLLVADYSQAAAATGYGTGADQPDPQRFFKWLVTYYNAHGGLGGRRIKPLYYTINGGANNWSTETQTACTALTQDNHVEAVVSIAWVHPALTRCLMRAGIPQIEGGVITNNDEGMLAQTPNLIFPGTMALDRATAALINGAVRQGWLTSKDKLGVVLDSCPYNTRVQRDVVVPLARRHGFTLDPIVAYDCGDGISGVSSFSSGLASAELRMRNDGVTQVMFLTQGQNGNLVFFSNYAASQQWRPGYLVNSLAAPSQTGAFVQKDQLQNVRGLGWAPISDVTDAPVTTAGRACVQKVVAGGGSAPTAPADVGTLLSHCDGVALLAAALAGSGGVGGTGPVRAATEKLGATFTSALALQGRTRFGAGRRDGAVLVAPLSYVGSCSCFRYVGSPTLVP